MYVYDVMKYVHVLNQYLKSVYVSLVQLYVAHIQYIHHTYIHTYIHTTLLAPLAKVGGMRYSTRLSKVRIHRGPSPAEQFWCMYIHGGADRGDDILLAPHRAARQIHVEGRKEGREPSPWNRDGQHKSRGGISMYVCSYVCMYAGRRMNMGPRRLEARRTRPSLLCLPYLLRPHYPRLVLAQVSQCWSMGPSRLEEPFLSLLYPPPPSLHRHQRREGHSRGRRPADPLSGLLGGSPTTTGGASGGRRSGNIYFYINVGGTTNVS